MFIFKERGGGKLEKKLTLKQKKFADEYIISGNAEQSAIKAGYSEKYARGNAHKLVANVGIKEYIEKKTKKKTEQMEYNIETVIEKLYETAYGLPQVVPYKVYNNLTKEWEVDEIKTVVPSMKDQNQARDMLMKMTGQYIERQEIEMKSSVQFVDDIESDLDETD